MIPTKRTGTEVNAKVPQVNNPEEESMIVDSVKDVPAYTRVHTDT